MPKSVVIRDRGMKNREQENGKAVVLAYEDSGVAISGDLGEPSFSGECEGIVSLQAPNGIEQEANPDPRFEYRRTNCCKLLSDGTMWFKIDRFLGEAKQVLALHVNLSLVLIDKSFFLYRSRRWF